jgi:hypothetical protein
VDAPRPKPAAAAPAVTPATSPAALLPSLLEMMVIARPDKRLGGVTGKGFLPGNSGNPSGRPNRRRMSERYETLMEQALPDDLRLGLKLKPGATWGDAIVLGQARAAIKGKTEAAREIADRVEGRARQPGEVSGGDEITGRAGSGG